jgi:transposase
MLVPSAWRSRIKGWILPGLLTAREITNNRKQDQMIVPKLGIDIAKKNFVVCLIGEKKQRKYSFLNDADGFPELSNWLNSKGIAKVHACMEATGRYGEKLAAYLHSQGHKVSIINPKFVKRHGEALNKQNKTDPNDAYVIAHYAQCFEPHEWQPRSVIQNELLDVVGQIALVKKTRAAFLNRGKCGLRSMDVLKVNEELIASLTKELLKLEKLKDALLAKDTKLKKTADIVDSTPGIGQEIAAAMAVKIDFAKFRNGRQLACYLGLSPREWQSGEQKRRGKQTKAGDDQLRALLRMGAMSATYTNPLYIEFAERLRQKGLKEGQILTAVARKMVMIAHALVRKQQLFDSCYVHSLTKAA